ncbi:MAG: hypothetical protein L0287_16395 [Anaerolineae bacterium]|nr:hypothetical protein [Anaerolineae bacterium]MCI0609929.1 hypothetical protein [Anaerolineae bacterium]
MNIHDVHGNQLVNELNALGVQFLRGGDKDNAHVVYQPVDLIIALASSPEARLRLALIPLFLQHPEYASFAVAAKDLISERAKIFCMCYYTAAYLFQMIYHKKIKNLLGRVDHLPDLFSEEVHLPRLSDPQARLKLLAQSQCELSGDDINWLGTYQHGVERWLRTLERKHGQEHERA